MMLQGSNSSTALSWVREDLDACLQSIRDNLEEYSEDRAERESLQHVQEKLEQLNLTFLTMQQRGATMLTDEMIAVGGNMLHNGDINMNDSLSALSDAIIVLPSYLDRLQAGHEDLPILLLPTLNELRASYDESLLSEGTLFAPDLEVTIPDLLGEPDEAVSPNDWPAFAQRVRSQYQTALLNWLKEQSNAEQIKPLQQVCRTVYSRAQRRSLRRLWWIADKIMDGLADGKIDIDLPLRRVFARLDLCLKAMVENGQEGPAEDSIVALSRALLFHVAQARQGHESIDLLRKLFRVDEIIPDRDALLRARGAVTGRDARLFHSIGQAIREEMASIKDSLDMELRTGRIDADSRSSIVSSLIQLSDTLHMLELPVPANALQELLPSLELTREVENFELDSPLLNLAQQLLEVESILDKHIQQLGEPIDEKEENSNIKLPRYEQRQIFSRMLDEAVTSLHAAQDAIRERLDGNAEADYSSHLVQISGAMHVSGNAEVAKLTDKMERAFNAALFDGGPSREEPGVALIMLTDAVAALELFLTGSRDEQANSLKFLDIMQDRLEGLPEATGKGEAVARTVVKMPAKPASADKPETPKPTAESAAPAQAAPPPAAVSGDDTLPPPIDASMQEIFLEEYETVMQDLREQVSQWLADPSAQKPLEDVRRGFHTLKGSGRMVGAKEVGDFCWRVEDLLNRVIDKKVDSAANFQRFLATALAALPHLKSRMVQQATELHADTVHKLSDAARTLARGGDLNIEALAALVPVMETEQPAAAPVEESAPAQPQAPSTETTAAEQPTAEEAEVAGSGQTEAPAADEAGSDSEIDPTLLQLMSGEIRQYLDALEPFVAAAESGTPLKVGIEQVRTAHSLVGSLSLAPAGDEALLAASLERYLQAQSWADQRPSEEAATTLRSVIDRFKARLAVLDGSAQADAFAAEDAALIEQLEALRTGTKAGDKVAAQEAIEEETTAPTPDPDEHAASEPEEPAEEAPQAAAEAPAEEAPEAAAEPSELDGLDREVLEIFLSESTEVLERCDTILNTWRDKLTDNKLVQNLQREIHTFKGGARMAGLKPLGDLSHAMETLLEKIAAGGIPSTVQAVQALEEGCDRLNIWVEMLHDDRLPEDGGSLNRFNQKVELLTSARHEKAVEPAAEQPAPQEGVTEAAAIDAEADQAADAPDTEDQQVPAVERVPGLAPVQTEIDKLESLSKEFREISDHSTGDDDAPAGAQIRVAASLMDTLVNYSGEISIYRARLEEQLNTVRFNLKEVDQTVARLNEQLRKMEMETEAQMLSRYQSASTKTSSEFDPLELDRFSNIQQVSRGLTETVSDLLNLHEMLDESVRQAENLLSSQSRVSADLQDGLMQTRMTPFASAAPRMRRVVRAAAAETNKKARLRLMTGGTSDRLDRNVLERITAPMEHMLRNAVVHGIEPADVRRKAGKPEEGVITVTVSAEMTEFVIRVQDDGGGLDLEAIRKRAIERGMIGKNENVSPRQLARFVLDSGFSTTKKVTGLAGRGVGMDVVNSEIKQIGGTLEIATEAGKGTRFTVRIPFSLAVMQAIGVSLGGHPYLVPLNSVAGVGRMTPTDYAKLIKRDSPSYEFAGESYPLMEMGPLLGVKPEPLESENVSLLMIDTGEARAAFRISDLRGHQEVVVKPIGPQISSIPGILGGTISGDGRVILILDVGPLIRSGAERAVAPIEPVAEEPEDLRPPLVMVIDDSITMRKVTTRVLESHALKVMTAKDGVDAIEKLHETIPDLILLDIEMPRMDGYELAEHIRSDSRLRKVPIIMVTSRAGQKHRKRARNLGVNGYLTKPYQENELIESVGDLLARNLSKKGE